MGVESCTIQQVPALKLLLPESAPAMAPPPSDASVAMDTVSLGPYGRAALLALHLVYEVCKEDGSGLRSSVCVFSGAEGEECAVCWAERVGCLPHVHDKVSFIRHKFPSFFYPR